MRIYRCIHSHLAECNNTNVEKYFQYAAEYSASMSEEPHSVTTMKKDNKETQIWLPDMVRILVEDRTKAHPETYQTIVVTLNRMYRSNDCPYRKFTLQDCKNKWHNMFPSSHDAVATVNYLIHDPVMSFVKETPHNFRDASFAYASFAYVCVCCLCTLPPLRCCRRHLTLTPVRALTLTLTLNC